MRRKITTQRSVDARHAVPGAHAETEWLSTGRVVSRGVTTYSAEQRRRGDKCVASCVRKNALRSRWHSETEKLSTRPRRVGRRDYIQRRELAKRDGLTDGILACPGGVSLTLRMTLFFLSF